MEKVSAITPHAVFINIFNLDIIKNEECMRLLALANDRNRFIHIYLEEMEK